MSKSFIAPEYQIGMSVGDYNWAVLKAADEQGINQIDQDVQICLVYDECPYED